MYCLIFNDEGVCDLERLNNMLGKYLGLVSDCVFFWNLGFSDSILVV